MLRPGSFAMTVLLALLTGLGPLSVDMYLASLPDIGRTARRADRAGAAHDLVLSGRLCLRAGVLRPAVRPARPPAGAAGGARRLSRWRRWPARWRPRSRRLIAARFCRRSAASGTIVLARAVVRDMYEGARVGRELSRMAAIMALAPLVAPLLGGVLQTAFGWRSNFVAAVLPSAPLALAHGVAAAAGDAAPARAGAGVARLDLALLSHAFSATASFVAHLGIATCCLAGLFAWISTRRLRAAGYLRPVGAGFRRGLRGRLGGLPGRHLDRGALRRRAGAAIARWAWAAVGMAAGGLVMVLRAGASACIRADGAGAADGALHRRHGLALPQAQAGALLPFPERAGAASSLVGFVQQTSSAVVGAILGHLLGQTAWPLAIAMAIVGCSRCALGADAEYPRALIAATDSAPSEQPVDQPVVDAAVGRRGRTGLPRCGGAGGGDRAPNGGSRPAISGPLDSPGRPATGTP